MTPKQATEAFKRKNPGYPTRVHLQAMLDAKPADKEWDKIVWVWLANLDRAEAPTEPSSIAWSWTAVD